MNDCLFCKIAVGEQKADIVHADDHVVAFRDIDPKAPTHILLIPREHIESVRAVRDKHAEMLVQLLEVAAHLAKAEGIDRTGWRIVTNVGPDAGQSVHHLHLHLLGGRQMDWPPG